MQSKTILGRGRWLGMATSAALLAAGLPAQAQVGIWTVPTSPGYSYTFLTDMADGPVVAGVSERPDGTYRRQSFTWSLSAGKTDLFRDKLPWSLGSMRISGDAQYIAGERVRVRLGDGAIDDVEAPSGRPMRRLIAISGDGSKLMGYAADASGLDQVTYTWTPQTGTRILPQEPGFLGRQDPYDMSRDGSTIVGTFNGSASSQAFVWREGKGYLTPKYADGSYAGVVRCVNSDGSVYASFGGSENYGGTRWINDVPSPLESLAGYSLVPEGMSNDGNVIVGYLDQINGDADRSFVWTPATGTLFVEDYLSANGVSVPQGVFLSRLLVSGDGLSIAGNYFDQVAFTDSGFVATVPAPAGTTLMFTGLLCLRRRSRHVAS